MGAIRKKWKFRNNFPLSLVGQENNNIATYTAKKTPRTRIQLNYNYNQIRHITVILLLNHYDYSSCIRRHQTVVSFSEPPHFPANRWTWTLFLWNNSKPLSICYPSSSSPFTCSLGLIHHVLYDNEYHIHTSATHNQQSQSEKVISTHW